MIQEDFLRMSNVPSSFFDPTSHWLPETEEGRLSLDVFRDHDQLVIRTPVAGVGVEDLDIAVDGDLLTIRGERHAQAPAHEEDWFYRECYWGSFSRSVILPMDVHAERVQAALKNGVLEIRFPIREQGRAITIRPTLME